MEYSLFPQVKAVTYMKFHPEMMRRPRYFVFVENILEHTFKKFLTDGKKAVLHCATDKKRFVLEIYSDTQSDVQSFQASVFIESIRTKLSMSTQVLKSFRNKTTTTPVSYTHLTLPTTPYV